jgi:type VII secretion protein EccB
MPTEDRGQRGSGYGLGLSTRTQVTGYQFLARRMAMALTRWRVRMEVEPGRRQVLAVVASVSAAVVICLGALLWSFISPAGSMGDSPIIADRNSGALYVRVGDTLYPALNLASARLIAGRADYPRKVRSSQIAQQPHGPLVGIPGAPSDISPTSPATSSWLVCDAVAPTSGVGIGVPAAQPVTVTVIDGTPALSDRRRVLGKQDAVLRRYGGNAYVIRDKRRSRINAADRSVLLPLGLAPEQIDQAPPMSRALFDALAVGPELSVPAVPGSGGPAAFPGAPGPVGSVIVTPQISGPQQYSLVLTNGVQTISPIVAQVLQNAGGPAAGSPKVVGPSALAKMPVVTGLDLSAFPDSPLNVVDVKDNPATCWWWQWTTGEDRALVRVVSGPTVPVGDTKNVVSLVKTDNSGGEADQVYFGPDYANFAVITGNDPAATKGESLWWLSHSGVRFGVDNTRDVRTALGLTGTPTPAPWVALRLLAPGPTLSRADALVEHGALPTDSKPQELAVPK